MPEAVAVAADERQLLSGQSTPRTWLIVFDLDGTLIDSSRDLTFSVNCALSEVGVPQLPSEAIASFIGDGASALMSRSLQASIGKEVSETSNDVRFPSALAAFFRAYRKHKLDTTNVYPGVIEALREIQQRAPDVLFAVLTNKPVRPSRQICDALQLSPFFFANYGGDSFPTKKPDPFGLQQIILEAKALSTVPERESLVEGVVMVGDAAPDVLVARAVGSRSIGCLYGLSPTSVLRERPDVLVQSPREWPDALGL